MPGGDKTGPMGMGPMTGRGAGFCAGYNMPGYINRGFGGGFGRGFGRGMGRGGGRGRRNMYYATGMPGWIRNQYGRPSQALGWGWGQTAQDIPPGYAPENELAELKREARALKASLDAINKRIGELDQIKDEH